MNIKIVRLSEQEVDQKGILSWPVWSCEISEFDWEYETRECCYLLEGEVEVKSEFF